MDKYDKLLESLSSNQEIPGKLGNNIGGNTNLDLTGEEELITSGLYDDMWDESSTSGFEDLPLSDYLCESYLYQKMDMNKKGNKARARTNKGKTYGKVAGAVAGTAAGFMVAGPVGAVAGGFAGAYGGKHAGKKIAKHINKKQKLNTKSMNQTDLQLEALYESSLFEGRVKRMVNNTTSKFGNRKASADNEKYHTEKAKNSKGLKKAYHNHRAGVAAQRKNHGTRNFLTGGLSATYKGMKNAATGGKSVKKDNDKMKKKLGY